MKDKLQLQRGWNFSMLLVWDLEIVSCLSRCPYFRDFEVPLPLVQALDHSQNTHVCVCVCMCVYECVCVCVCVCGLSCLCLYGVENLLHNCTILKSRAVSSWCYVVLISMS